MMSAFQLALHISTLTRETVSYTGIPTSLLGPYFPLASLSIIDFVAYNVAPLPGSTAEMTTSISMKPVTHISITESYLHHVKFPHQTTMENIIHTWEDSDDNLGISLQLGTSVMPIELLAVWKIWLALCDLQVIWQNSMQWLERQDHQNSPQKPFIEKIRYLLCQCSWNDPVGFMKHDCSSISCITQYISISCLTSTNIDHNSEIL